MNNKIFWIVPGLLAIIIGIYLSIRAGDLKPVSDKPMSNEVTTLKEAQDILNCYWAKVGPAGKEDVFELSPYTVSDGRILGVLEYNHFEKDDSIGEFEAHYKNGLLYGTYYFHSEGVESKAPVIFKKDSNGFIQGNVIEAVIDANDGKYHEFKNVDYTNGIRFTEGDCKTAI